MFYNNHLEAILFDFDDTLVHTDELKEFRESGSRQELKQNAHLSWCYDNVPKLLHSIREKNIPIGLVTNSPRWYIDILIDHHNLGEFDTIVTYDDVSASGIKPSPLGINKALSNLGLTSKSRVIYIGDTDIDFVAAYEVGIKPIAPSWASKHPIHQVPAAILNSDTLIHYIEHFDRIALIADQTASKRTFNFEYDQLNFIPLNDKGNVTAINKDDVRLLALGRYFSQKSKVTALYHESHQLSKDIFEKERSETYVIPGYYVDLMVKVIDSLSLYKFRNSVKKTFDIITVIPSKQGKNPRLENYLKRISRQSTSDSQFVTDLFEFSHDATSSKTVSGGHAARYANIDGKLHVKEKYRNALVGKSVLIIDDVITTGATIKKAFELLEFENVGLHMGVVLAKTVSISEEQRSCPECHSLLRIRTNHKNGIHFYGCTGFYEPHKCTYKENIVIKKCPKCEGNLIKRKKHSYFLACDNFTNPQIRCRHMEPWN